MTLIGGFMIGYGVINRHDILGSAQTGNMVSLAMDAVGHADEEWFFRIIALIIYVASVSLTVILSHKISKMSQKRLSILIDGAVLLIIGFYPAEMNPFVLQLFSGVHLKEQMVLQAPVFFVATIFVSA